MNSLDPRAITAATCGDAFPINALTQRATRRVFGALLRSPYRRLRTLIVAPEATASGNIVLPIGREYEPATAHPGDVAPWERTEAIVLTREEARTYVVELQQALAAAEAHATVANSEAAC